jgi:uracil-DNA glycosylase family 4
VPVGQFEQLCGEIASCRKCARLVAWRETAAAQKRASFCAEAYWGKPLPGFGDRLARLAVVGLAPAAHGGNRTGRVFTGDRSGDWLWAALWRAGLANRPESMRCDDGLEARGVWVTAAVRCPPPQNRPTTAERDNCLPYLQRELGMLPNVRAVLALGGFAYEACCRLFGLRQRPRFGHGAETLVNGGCWLVCSYHPSQQNTFTGRLTEQMLDVAVRRAWELAGQVSEGPAPEGQPEVRRPSAAAGGPGATTERALSPIRPVGRAGRRGSM